jgi:hypothetical protein
MEAGQKALLSSPDGCVLTILCFHAFGRHFGFVVRVDVGGVDGTVREWS